MGWRAFGRWQPLPVVHQSGGNPNRSGTEPRFGGRERRVIIRHEILAIDSGAFVLVGSHPGAQRQPNSGPFLRESAVLSVRSVPFGWNEPDSSHAIDPNSRQSVCTECGISKLRDDRAIECSPESDRTFSANSGRHTENQFQRLEFKPVNHHSTDLERQTERPVATSFVPVQVELESPEPNRIQIVRLIESSSKSEFILTIIVVA